MPLLGIFPCNGILGGSYSIFKRTNWKLCFLRYFLPLQLWIQLSCFSKMENTFSNQIQIIERISLENWSLSADIYRSVLFGCTIFGIDRHIHMSLFIFTICVKSQSRPIILNIYR